MTWGDLLQAAILVLTGWGLWLTGSRGRRQQRRGYLLCLAAQPLWLADTLQHRQWGMFLLTCWLTASFIRAAVARWR